MAQLVSLVNYLKQRRINFIGKLGLGNDYLLEILSLA